MLHNIRPFQPKPQRLAANWAATLLCVVACASAHAQDTMQTTRATVSSLGSGIALLNAKPKVEQIKFSGSATIKSKLGKDPDFNQPVLDLLIDMNGVVATGAASKTSFPLTSQHTLTVPFVPNQTIEILFPIETAGQTAAMSTVRTGLASFAINTDPATGAITSVSASLSAN